MKSKRILCVTSNFPRWRGDSTTPFVLHLAQDLQELGWQVDVLAPHAESGTASHECIDGVRVERFHYLWPRRAQTVCYHGGALINLRENPVNFVKLPALVFFQWLAILCRIVSGRYDIIHSHWVLPQGFTGALAGWLGRVPQVITVHGGDVFALKGGLLARFKRFSLRRSARITVNSSVTRSAVQALAPGLEQLHTIPMGVGVDAPAKTDDQVRVLRQRYARNEGPLLVFLGRVVEEKGVEDFICAVALLRQSLPSVRALVVGEGQHRGSCEALARDLGLDTHLEFTGWVDATQVGAYLAAADVFIGPSRKAADGWVEAQGLTFLEAMVARTPVVATRSGGIVDSVEHDVTGLLVDERAPEQIADAVQRIVSEPELGERLASAAWKQVKLRFSRRASAEAFSALLSGLLGEHKENGP